MTTSEAYRAMFIFLDAYWARVGEPDELGALLGMMSILEDGSTVDPAIRSYWLEAVEKAKESDDDGIRMVLTTTK